MKINMNGCIRRSQNGHGVPDHFALGEALNAQMEEVEKAEFSRSEIEELAMSVIRPDDVGLS